MKKIKISKKSINKLEQLNSKCTDCGLCMKNCPMVEKFNNSPKEFFEKITNEREIDINIPYSCALCGYCSRVCPQNISLKEILLDLRQQVVKKYGQTPKFLGTKGVKFHQKNSFSRVFTHSFKPSYGRNSNIVFIPGCSLSSYSPYIVEKTYDYLREKIPGIGILLECCGNPTKSIGEQDKFRKYYSKLQKHLDSMKIDEVIVACENCYATIKENSSNVKVTSLWEVIANYGVTEQIKERAKNVNTIFTIHDPCSIRNEKNIHDSVRKIAYELGLQIREFEFCREKTLCCGLGGMLAVTNNKLATKQMKKRANQTEEKHILSYCEACVEAMKKGGKNSVHILDIMFNDELYEKKYFNQNSINTIQKWINRYKTKRMIKKLK